MDFAELIAQMREPGEAGLPEDFADQLQAAYDDTVNVYTDSSATLTEQLEAAQTGITTAQADRDAAIADKTKAQAHNTRLLRSIPMSKGTDTDNSGGDDGQGLPEPVTIESLIEYK